MKKIAMMAAGFMAVSLVSCSSDEPNVNGGGNLDGKGDVFASLTLDLPTRSATVDPTPGGNDPAQSSDGYEYGLDFENNVDVIAVVLASKEDDGTFSYVTSSQSNSILDVTSATPTYVIQFESKELQKEAGNSVYVFAYCNPTREITTFISGLKANDKFADETGVILEGGDVMTDSKPISISISQPKNFLMTNATLTSTPLPSYESMVQDYNTKERAFNLGNVKVERVSCRFDFAPTTIEGQTAANVYPIKEQISNTVFANVELQGMALFNEAKEFYLLPRMSTDAAGANPIICGNELPGTYVVSPNVQTKLAYLNGDGTGAVPSDLYFFPISTLPGKYNYTSLADIANGLDDNHTSNQKPTWPAVDGFKIWRYATENTIPGVANQRHGVTTGIVFKAEIKAIENPGEGTYAKILADAMGNGETVYAYTDNPEKKGDAQISVVLGSAMDVYNYAKSHNTSAIRTKFVEAAQAGYFKLYDADGNLLPATDETVIFTPADDKKVAKVTGENVNNNATYAENNNFGFIAYAPVAGEDGKNHYYTYYYYYNRHNDNGRGNEMGVMEFATVRNNIYKIKVDNVMKFGLPTDTPPDPWTPDETPDVYFKVSVQVLDWLVRINHIIL